MAAPPPSSALCPYLRCPPNRGRRAQNKGGRSAGVPCPYQTWRRKAAAGGRGGEPGPGAGRGRARRRTGRDGARQRPGGEEGGTGCGTEAGSGGRWGGGGRGRRQEKREKEAKQGGGSSGGFALRTRRGQARRLPKRLPTPRSRCRGSPPPSPLAFACVASSLLPPPGSSVPRGDPPGARPVYMRGKEACLEPRRRVAGEGLLRGAAAETGPRARTLAREGGHRGGHPSEPGPGEQSLPAPPAPAPLDAESLRRKNTDTHIHPAFSQGLARLQGTHGSRWKEASPAPEISHPAAVRARKPPSPSSCTTRNPLPSYFPNAEC
ncbi:WAS/WASL-interacting protein family member 1-like [Pogoniulus pusillus]|uniref:WAS/WASL-interacting protein family member 1-like n=1 Tax=Pogoniulus pusillus TaxID=488313 RepID=UPI0030B93BE2